MKHRRRVIRQLAARSRTEPGSFYGDWIIIENIPDRAYGYELGSRLAIGCVMESWRVRTNKASGIVNDPNDWAIERDDATYVLDRC
jgi:predicted helicase